MNYHLKTRGEIEGLNHIPPTKIDLNADGKLYEIKINELNLNNPEGSAHFSGSSNWQDRVQWDISANFQEMNLKPYVPDIPAVLSGKIHSQGHIGVTNWKVEVPTVDLVGRLSSRPLSLKGRLFLSDDALLNIPNLQLNYGNNHLTAKGILGEESDLNLDINAPDLRGLWQDLAGSVVGKAQILGKLTAPTINTDLTAQGLHFQGLDLSKVLIKGHVVSEPQVKGELNVKAENFRYGDALNYIVLI